MSIPAASVSSRTRRFWSISLPLSMVVGYLFLDEVPSLAFRTGAAITVAVTLAVSGAPSRSLDAGLPTRTRS